MRRAVIELVALGVLACQPAPEPSVAPLGPAVSEEQPRDSADVATERAPLDWRTVYTVDEGAGSFALVEIGARLRDNARGGQSWVYDGLHPLLVQVVNAGPELVEVRLDWPERASAHHCAGARAGLGLRAFVETTALLEVVTRATSIELADGSGLNVASGVPVVRRADEIVLSTRAKLNGTGFVMSDGFSIALDPVALQTGVSYVPIASASIPTPLDRELTGELRYGGRSLRVATGLAQRVYQQPEASGRLSLGSACLQLAGAFDPGPAPEAWPSTGGSGCSRPSTTSRELWALRVGAALTWPDGEDAGEVFRRFVHVGKLRRRGDRRCFELTLACGEHPGPQVCVSAADISGGQLGDLNSTGLLDGS
ncbi:hypothetical protein [Enhygromyxa salina]|uniref:hypothetical protein n=1 Tax=Enhygromyxa salina TaxID=215803 RepID=UPI0004E77246|nr:hypothetical protein [Enhygromyxa salina]